MSTLFKLRPDRDLQCYFRRPSSHAAISEATQNSFQLSGTWREQFDWAVLEWNRDNVFEHPRFRNLPDGDFRGVQLGYVESRVHCHLMDSDLFPFVDWPFLRIWATPAGGVEEIYKVRLRPYATPETGGFVPATCMFELLELPAPGEYVGIGWLTEHHTYQVLGADTPASVVSALAASVNAFDPYMEAEVIADSKIKLHFCGTIPGSNPAGNFSILDSRTGQNGNRVSAYSYATGGTQAWDINYVRFADGQSPSSWRVNLPFDNLVDDLGRAVPVQNIRKMRWTFAAAQQWQQYERAEFSVQFTDWTVSGARRGYQVAGPGSFRVEDNDARVSYTGVWNEARGNYSAATIRVTSSANATAVVRYESLQNHRLYLGSRFAHNGAKVGIRINEGAETLVDVRIAGEDRLCRIDLGVLPVGKHTVTIRQAGLNGEYFYFDFLEAAIGTAVVSPGPIRSAVTAATDWDTDHSLPLAPERTADMLFDCGFRGRVNNYVGALVFYEMHNPESARGRTTITLSGTPPWNSIASLHLGTTAQGVTTTIDHLVHPGSTVETIAAAFANELNRGATALGATANGNQLTVWARAIGVEGNDFTATVSTNQPGMTIAGGGVFAGGTNGNWWTDMTATPRLNRACRDWTRSFLKRVKAQGLDATSAYSTELQHGDWRPAAGFAQRYWLGSPVIVMTPAVQTNFSTVSINYWKEVYRDTAQLHVEAGLVPYLQFGEVQWWYFSYNPPGVIEGMPFYDDYTKQTFQQRFGRPMQLVSETNVNPVPVADELQHCADLLGEYCVAIMDYVRQTYPECRFEVLYPLDVNESPVNARVNYPTNVWTPALLDCLKTEGFGITATNNLDAIRHALGDGKRRGFSPQKNAHLTGCLDTMIPWQKEVEMIEALGMESAVLWAIDQFCLIGFPLHEWNNQARSQLNS
jgi:hypothetical protein